jgi:hypothetical protein
VCFLKYCLHSFFCFFLSDFSSPYNNYDSVVVNGVTYDTKGPEKPEEEAEKYYTTGELGVYSTPSNVPSESL